MYDATVMDPFRAVAAGIAVISLIAFATLFDPGMRGNERALLDVGLTAALVGAAATVLKLRGRRSSAPILPIALLVLAAVMGIMSFGDLRTDRGNKKALVALGIAAMSGSALITSLVVRRSLDVADEH